MVKLAPLHDSFSVAETTELVHADRIWLAEIIRRIETPAWLDDFAVLRKLIPLTASRSERILRRAFMLGEARGLVSEISAWHSHGRMVFGLFALLALLGGFSLAATALGDASRSVNILFALLSLLGVHLLALAIWLLSLLFASRAAPGGLASAGMRLTAWLTRREYRPVMLAALTTMLGRARLYPWLIGALSHLLWCAAFIGVLGGLLFLLAFREYQFNWDTTILSAGFFITLTQTLGQLPQWLGFPTPDPALLGAAEHGAQAAWAYWLIGCVLVYGLVPRLLFAVLCLLRARAGLARLAIDPALDYYIELQQRIQVFAGIGTIVDPDTGEHSMSLPPRRANVAGASGVLLLGIEIADDLHWPPVNFNTRLPIRKVASGAERQQLLRDLSGAPLQKLLIAVDAHASPDRGNLRLIAELSAYAVQCKVWLLLQAGRSADAERLLYWQEELGNIGMSTADVLESEPQARRWLEQAHE